MWLQTFWFTAFTPINSLAAIFTDVWNEAFILRTQRARWQREYTSQRFKIFIFICSPPFGPQAFTGNRQSRSFFKKCLYLVASKLSLEVVPFWKTQANSGDHSATMFLSVFVFFLAFSLGLGI
jgi:hypothetical protein